MKDIPTYTEKKIEFDLSIFYYERTNKKETKREMQVPLHNELIYLPGLNIITGLWYSSTIKISPNYIKLLDNYNKGCEIAFQNLANARKINNQ